MGFKQTPERFHAYENEPWHSRGLRIMLADNYCVLYIPDAKNAVITIIRVMNGSNDIDTQLRKYTKQ